MAVPAAGAPRHPKQSSRPGSTSGDISSHWPRRRRCPGRLQTLANHVTPNPTSRPLQQPPPPRPLTQVIAVAIGHACCRLVLALTLRQRCTDDVEQYRAVLAAVEAEGHAPGAAEGERQRPGHMDLACGSHCLLGGEVGDHANEAQATCARGGGAAAAAALQAAAQGLVNAPLSFWASPI